MDELLVQRSRYLLQARVRRAKSCPQDFFETALAQLLRWAEQHPVLAHVVATMRGDERYMRAKEKLLSGAGLVLKEPTASQQMRQGPVEPVRDADLRGHAAIGLATLDLLVEQPAIHLQRLAAMVNGCGPNINPAAAYDMLRDIALDGVYDYLDETLDGRNVFIAMLVKYKHRSERFRRQRLRNIVANGLEGQAGERALVIDLYEYLHDQNVEFHLEPESPSGWPDLVSEPTLGERKVLDGKFLAPDDPPSKVKKKLADGLHQVIRYCADFQEPIGYMVIYNASRFTLNLPHEVHDGFPCVRVSGKSVYFVEVRLHDGPSASKAGKAEVLDFTLDELRGLAEDAP